MDAVLGCRPVSSRLISIRLKAAPFNITIIQVYATTSGHDDSEVDHFYQLLQETIDQTPKKDILVVQGDWNAKVGKDAQAVLGEVCGGVGKNIPQKLTQLSPRSHARHLVGKKDSTNRRHQRHHQRQPGEQPFPIQVATG